MARIPAAVFTKVERIDPNDKSGDCRRSTVPLSTVAKKWRPSSIGRPRGERAGGLGGQIVGDKKPCHLAAAPPSYLWSFHLDWGHFPGQRGPLTPDLVKIKIELHHSQQLARIST